MKSSFGMAMTGEIDGNGRLHRERFRPGLAKVPARSRIIDCARLANKRALRRQMWTRAL